MLKQKEMIAGTTTQLATAHETGSKVVYTFVPGNLTELSVLRPRARPAGDQRAAERHAQEERRATSRRRKSAATPRTSAPTSSATSA